MDISQMLRLLRRRWYLIVACGMIAALIGAGWASMQPRLYSANASGTVTPSTPSTDPSSAAVYENLAKSKVASYVQWAESRSIAEYVIDTLDLSVTPEGLVSQITVSNPESTPVITVSAIARSPEAARDIATTWIQGLAIEGAELDGGSLDGSKGEPPVLILQVTEHAALPSSPISPNLRIALVLSLGIGLAIGFGITYLLTILDRRVRSVDQLEEAFGLPVIGTLPQVKTNGADDRIVVSGVELEHNARGGFSRSAESFRELRTNLQYVHVDNPPRIIVVSSAVPGEGKSAVSANLALTMAAAGQPVVIVDADLRKPTVAKTFGLVEGVGLTDVLAGRAEIDDVVQTYNDTPNLLVIGAGRVPPNPSELLGTNAMRSMLEELSESAIVLLDAPPLVPVTDAAILAPLTDGIIVVTNANSTSIDLVEKALANLKRVNVKPLGLILNRLRRSGNGSGYYGYSSYYYYGADDGAKKAKAPKARHGVQRQGAEPIRSGTRS